MVVPPACRTGLPSGPAANRAFANLKCENYGSAITDADEALRLDPEFIKANYRKGAALSAWRLALTSALVLACTTALRSPLPSRRRQWPSRSSSSRRPSSRACAGSSRPTVTRGRSSTSARRPSGGRRGEGERGAPPQATSLSPPSPRAQAFEDAIGIDATKPISEQLGGEVDRIDVDASYTGPRLPAVPAPDAPQWTPAQLLEEPSRVNHLGASLEFVLALVEHFRGQRCVHRKYAIQVRTPPAPAAASGPAAA